MMINYKRDGKNHL